MKLVAGVDEAGRGPLAGPVVAAAVILPHDFPKAGLKDSKKLSLKEREYFFALIKAKAVSVGIGIVSAKEIDQINIFQASLKAMAIAVSNLSYQPQKIFVDGRHIIPNLAIPQEAVIKGDNLHPCIMCASIVAKVTRDCLMEKLHLEYPQYGFNQHKGYGTKRHLRALQKHGPSPVHRKSFAPVKELSLLSLKGY